VLTVLRLFIKKYFTFVYAVYATCVACSNTVLASSQNTKKYVY